MIALEIQMLKIKAKKQTEVLQRKGKSYEW